MAGIDRMVIVETESYPIDGPLLWYLRRLGEAEGLPVTAVPPGTAFDGHPLLVGHGPASREATTAVRRSLPLVLLAPHLDEPDVADALMALHVPGFVAGAVTDPHWNRRVAAHLTPMEILQLPVGDHRLEIDGDPLGSLEILRRILDRCRALVARLPRVPSS